MARGGITMQINAPRGLQDPVQFHQAHGHHGEVGHHVVGAQEAPERLEEVGELPGAQGHHFVVRGL